MRDDTPRLYRLYHRVNDFAARREIEEDPKYVVATNSFDVFGRWLPLSDLREVMEFKIVHFFFRTTFALPTTFNFSLYMREATDNHILALVDVESSTWVILAAVCFLNLARIKIWQVFAWSFFASENHESPPLPASE